MKGIFLFFFLLHVPDVMWAQTSDSDVAAWYLPGVSWQVSKKVSLVGELGYNQYYTAGLGYLQGFITVHKNLVLNPGYIYYGYKNSGQEYRQEHFLMNSVIGQLPMGKFLLDDRNTLWNRISYHAEPLHYYRNRLRLIRSFLLGHAGAKVYGYDEAFYQFNSGRWMRNRLALGASYDVLRHANLDITYIRQWDHSSGWLHLFFITATWKI
jgi:hypothetical protein